MNRRVVALVLIFVVVGAGTVLLLFPRNSASFHLSAEYPDGEKEPVYLYLLDLEECALNISFIDDPDLLYDMNIELDGSHPASSTFDLIVKDYRDSNNWMEVDFREVRSVTGLQVVLGSGVPYWIVVTGTSVNATVVYGNNVLGSDASFDYRATGTYVNMIMTEDVVFASEGMEVDVGTGGVGMPDSIYFNLDLPEGINGIGSFSKPLYIHANTGWSWYSEGGRFISYSTPESSLQPLVEIVLSAEYSVHVWLSD
jgi:hypothetical protein